MADKGPNWKAEQLKIHIAIENLKVNRIRSQLEIIEAEGRIEACQKNINATHQAVSDAEEKLSVLMEKHGNLIEGVM